MRNDTIGKTFLIAGLLSIVCSAFVSSSAVFLRPNQERNKDLDRKKNILMAAGLYDEGTSIDDQFQQFEIKVVDLATGEFTDEIDAATFDQRKAAKSPDFGIEIDQVNDLAGIKRRSQYAVVYISQDDSGSLNQLILPVHGKGLWSTMYGFLALDADLATIKGFAFYEHGETPGLGGEIDNPRWKEQWVGKKAFDEMGMTRIEVIKGIVNPSNPDSQYQVDGLSGATITSRGVKGLLQYWLGENGFKPLLTRIQKKEGGNHG